jgi:hypothetical protein
VTPQNTDQVKEKGNCRVLISKSKLVAAAVLLTLCLPNALGVRAVSAAEPTQERNFYDVLEDVLGDFEYDLKNSNVTGLKDLALRNVALSENVPASFKSHLELLITEKILKNTKSKVLQCLPCRARRSTLTGDQMVITSPETNPAELARIAKMSGIAHFLDLAFSYQPNGMVLSMYITEPENGSVVWSRSYNSETSRASAFRRGVDYSQLDEARKSTEYTPTLQYRALVGYVFEPNLSGMTGCLAFGGRMVERYDNRKKEVGFEVDYLKDASTLINGSAAGATAAAADNLYSGINLTMLFVHAWNFIGNEEDFNKVRGSLSASVGGTYASGFLGGVIRSGYEWRLGKHTAVSTMLGYRPSSTAFIGTTAATGTSVSGLELGLGINLLF